MFPPSHSSNQSEASATTPAAPVPPATPGAARGTVRREQEEVHALVRAKEWVKVANHPYFLHVANPQQLTAVIGKLQAATEGLPPGEAREDHEFAVALLRSLLKKRSAAEADPTRPGQKPTTGGDPRPTPAGTQPAAHLAVPPPPPAAPASPPAPRDAANKARVEALAAHWTASHRPGGSPATPMPPTPAACPQPPATRPTAPPTYYDCPICGQAVADDSYSPGKSVGCPQCGNEFIAATGLNRRTTPQPVETRGFLGQLLWGKTVQTPVRTKLVSTIRVYDSMASSAAASGNFEQAQFFQMRAMDARRQLENT